MASLNGRDKALSYLEGAPSTLHRSPRQAPSSQRCSVRQARRSSGRSRRQELPSQRHSPRKTPSSQRRGRRQAQRSSLQRNIPRQAAPKLGDSAVQSSPPLEIRTASHSWDASVNFNDLKCIGKYSTTNDGTYSDLDRDTNIARLIPDVTNSCGTNLSTGSSEAVLIPKYKDYHNQKQENFLKWIHDNDFFAGVAQGKYKKPEFISSGGCIVYPMMTPDLALYGDWEIYAVKIRDVIYLWGDTLGDSDGSIESYYGFYFEHLLTHENPSATIPNQYKKVYAVNEIHFGSHQLLCASDIDAQDDRSRWVEIKVFKEAKKKTMETKHLKFWAQSVVTGAEFVVLGTRDDNGDVCHIEITETDNLTQKFPQSPVCYYDFQNRFLTWIKSHFNESNPKKVKKFKWQYKFRKDISSSDVAETEIPTAFIPRWYVESLTNEEEMDAKKTS